MLLYRALFSALVLPRGEKVVEIKLCPTEGGLTESRVGASSLQGRPKQVSMRQPGRRSQPLEAAKEYAWRTEIAA